jgi:hypothetical protein
MNPAPLGTPLRDGIHSKDKASGPNKTNNRGNETPGMPSVLPLRRSVT